jgi:multidrug efflux pump subunit AcrB
VLISGASEPDELRNLANQFEQDLLRRGIDKIGITGVPDQEVAIQVSSNDLESLQLSLDDIGERVGRFSMDMPAGSFGDRDGARELRSLDQRRDAWGFAKLPVISDRDNRIDLGSVATIQRQAMDGQVTLSADGKPTIELSLRRAEKGNSLTAAKILEQWLADTRPTLPPGIELHVYDQSWQLIKDRISLLLNNGAGGLALVVLILYLFLTGRVAFWVALGIPVSFMATLGIMYVAGGSINMISLFALIMALGIIVDDAIVVGEDALAHYQAGEESLLAAEGGARRMLAPVTASSLTTIAAFLPLMIVGGIIGNILFAIPMVIISVILASLIESFFVLPGHLRHAFAHLHHAPARGLRKRLEKGFERFREGVFRPLAVRALDHRGTTLSLSVALLILAIGLLVGGRLSFTFFPTPEAQIIYANASFVSGTPRERVDAFLVHLQETLRTTEASLGEKVLSTAAERPAADPAVEAKERGLGGAAVSGNDADTANARRLIETMVTKHGSTSDREQSQRSGDQFGSVVIELSPSDQRSVRNGEFIKAWREHIEVPPGMESFTITARQAGPPGRDLNVRLTGPRADDLKQAALALAEGLKTIPGVGEIEDDLPYGREQLIYQLTPAGEALGLTVLDLGRQLRTAFDGKLVQLFQDGPDEVEVRVKLPTAERERLTSLERINVRIPSGEFVPLSSVAQWNSRRGFEALRHADGQLAVEVTADIDEAVNNTNRVIASISANTLPELSQRYGVSYTFEGRAAEQADTLADMRRGLIVGLALIYLVLAWVFASYGWPLVVMTAIPLGLVGALTGHWIMGLDLTILSLFGFFGLSGIVVNDSIILVSFYKRLRDSGMGLRDALVEAAVQRLRAVLLTSLTTIAGLTPLLFETSLQAQFLIPMATSIAFGLAFATALILLVIPALLSYYEDLRERWPNPAATTLTSG